jgi:hypothetical protein
MSHLYLYFITIDAGIAQLGSRVWPGRAAVARLAHFFRCSTSTACVRSSLRDFPICWMGQLRKCSCMTRKVGWKEQPAVSSSPMNSVPGKLWYGKYSGYRGDSAWSVRRQHKHTIDALYYSSKDTWYLYQRSYALSSNPKSRSEPGTAKVWHDDYDPTRSACHY